MMQDLTYGATGAAIATRLARLPLVLLLTVGLLFSLLHCTGCEAGFVSSDGPVAAVSHDQGSAPDAPEQIACHSGHCLAHVTTQPAPGVTVPADFHPRPHVLRDAPFPVSLAGLPLFKPPRA